VYHLTPTERKKKGEFGSLMGGGRWGGGGGGKVVFSNETGFYVLGKGSGYSY